jgi:hypothetical protein
VTSPLFGPDGTELPEPPPVLPDPLLGATGAESTGPTSAQPPDLNQRWAPPPNPAQTAEAERLRRAIAAALGEPEEPAPPSRSVQPPPPIQPPPIQPAPFEPEPKTPPAGIPLPTAAQFQPVPPVPPLPRQAHAQRLAQGWRAPRRQRNPLIQERITRPGSAWVGCLVVLIFFVAVAFNAVQTLIGALIDLFR